MRTCGTHAVSTATRQRVLSTMRSAAQHNTADEDDKGNAFTIPVVVHICFDDYDEAVIEADVEHTIRQLNKDFDGTCDNFDYARAVYDNDESFASLYDTYVERADFANVQFALDSIRYASVAPQFVANIAVLDRQVKGKSPAVRPESTLNVWVADIRSDLLGYAQFPWELRGQPSTDGVLIAKSTFGRWPESQAFNLGKTLTHEVGHWLGLYHTFQETFDYEGGDVDYTPETDQDNEQQQRGDCVIDTPWQAEPSGGNPFETPQDWPKSRPRDEAHAEYHMFMNFMDYSDDQALFMFTRDQCTKMRLLVRIYRPLLLENDESADDQDNNDDNNNDDDDVEHDDDNDEQDSAEEAEEQSENENAEDEEYESAEDEQEEENEAEEEEDSAEGFSIWSWLFSFWPF